MKWLKRVVVLALVAVGAIGFAVLVADWILIHPVQTKIAAPPDDLQAREVTFAASDQIIVHGWWSPVANSPASVLLLPGIRANRTSMIGRARFLRVAGYSVLLIDLRGTGETNGERITFGWSERLDVQAAVDFLHRQHPTQKIGIIGSSLGGAAAIFAKSPNVDALVVEAVYPSLRKATQNRLRKYFGMPGSCLTPLFLTEGKLISGESVADLRPIDWISEVGCPLFVLGGTLDANTTVEDSHALFAAAHEPKQLWLVPGAKHVDLHHFAPAEYERRVLEFFADHLTYSD